MDKFKRIMRERHPDATALEIGGAKILTRLRPRGYAIVSRHIGAMIKDIAEDWLAIKADALRGSL